MSDILFGDDGLISPPVTTSGETFAEAGARLTRQELSLVQGVLSGLKPADAARKAYPSKKNINAAEVLRKPHVAAALELGRKELAVAVQRDAKYSVVEAIAEVDEKIRAAHARGADSAIASMLSLKAKLAGLLVERHEVQQAGFVIQVAGVDPMKMANPARVIDAEVVGEE